LDFYSVYWHFQIKKFIKENRIDVLHIHDLYLAKSIIKPKMKLSIPVNVDLHENYIEALKAYTWSKKTPLKQLINYQKWNRLEEKILSQVNHIIVLSDFFQSMLQKKYTHLSEDKFISYPNYPNHTALLKFKIDHNILSKDNSFIIFYFGAIAERRGILRFSSL
jgi:glycosyltransferase involved in cell wall biosynthesis